MVPSLIGKQCVGYVRSATVNVDSLAKQSAAIRRFAAANQMVLTDEVEVVCGSPRNEEDFVQTFANRKRDRNDFEVVLVASWDRLTRSGYWQAQKITSSLQKLGVAVIAVEGDQDGSECAWMKHHLDLYVAKAYSRQLSLRTRMGLGQSIRTGAVAYTSKTPLGIDRLYLDSDGKEQCIIRIQPTGGEVMLQPSTGQVICVFKAGSGYRKHRSQRVVLIPGAADAVEVVRRIYRDSFEFGKSPTQVAKSLNAEACLSPTGKLWSGKAVIRTLGNPVYLGIGIAGRMTRSPFVNRLNGWTIGRVKIVHRDPQEWLFIEYPSLRHCFVGSSIYEARWISCWAWPGE
jgi:DNA invertase Pin-like site-specific DNA recombinase